MGVFIRSCRDLLQRPLSVFIISSVFAIAAILLDGTLFRIWSLNRDHEKLTVRIESLKRSVAEKERRIHEANKPEFIERQVREQLDFVRAGDLVFVFSDASVSTPASSTLRAKENASR